ncbi:acyltransferase [Megamonas hypermegale]|uniref:acyltransferase n=1 Tax=Megamonas hypermegale TaxID=158847 RepID=UPI00242B0D00|nr:acyltransferase [Megamonas hypermegale]
MFKLTNEMSNKIQICRAIAIIAVVIIHNCPQEYEGIVIRCFVNFAVALFIFLSGYLTRIINTDIMTFYKKRLLRVIIPYCIWSVLYTIAFNKWDDFIFNFITGQCCGIYYFIIVYMQLTILVPWISKLIQSKYWKLGFLITPISIAIEYIYTLNDNTIAFPFNALFFVVWFIFFYLGMCIRNGNIRISSDCKNFYYLFAIGYVVQLIESIIWYTYGNYNMATTQLKFSAILCSVIVSIIAYLWITKEIRILYNRISQIFIMIGNYSFGIYLTHIALMAVLGKTVYKFIDIIFPFNIVLIILIEVIGISLMVKFCGKKVCKYLGLI